MPTVTRTSRKRGERAPLTRESIARAALAIIDAEGMNALSTRRLGEELGVEAMSLYHHLPGKDAILDAVMEALLEEVEFPRSGHWVERMRAGALSYRAMALRHPRAFLLVVTRPFMTERVLQFCDDALASIRAGGFDEAMTAHVFRLFGHFLDGACIYESEGPARRAGAPVPPPVAVDEERFPHRAAARPHRARARAGEHFEFGLEQLLQLIESLSRSK
jgi:AcrR family transcriptional regulator